MFFERMGKVKKFIEELQLSDEETKKKWVVGSSAVVIAVVIFMWLVYFNNLVGVTHVPSSPPSPAAEGEYLSLWGRAGRAAASVFYTLRDALGAVGSGIFTPKNFIIEPGS